MVPAERTVTVAVGHGKKAARNTDAYLRGETTALCEARRCLYLWRDPDGAGDDLRSAIVGSDLGVP